MNSFSLSLSEKAFVSLLHWKAVLTGCGILRSRDFSFQDFPHCLPHRASAVLLMFVLL